MGQSKIEIELNINMPYDIESVWAKSEWNKSNSTFTLYNYNPFYLLNPLNEDEIIRQSKILNGFLRNNSTKAKKSLVFAKSFLEDDGQFLFYAFDENNVNVGIWVWHLDKGPQFPSKICSNLKEVFGEERLMIKGFANSDQIRNTWIKASNRELNESDFMYGNFPMKDLKKIAMEICPELLFIPNETTFLVSDEKKNEVSEFYSSKGRNGLLSEMNNIQFQELLQRVNMEKFNQNKETKIFLLHFYNNPELAICNCSKKQAQELNKFGFFTFENLKDSKQSSKFMNDEK